VVVHVPALQHLLARVRVRTRHRQLVQQSEDERNEDIAEPGVGRRFVE
jgi:hypothetical protein